MNEHKLNQHGFVMPTVIILMSIMVVVAYAALMQANNSLSLAYKQAYIQMARVASKAAVDYSQEQFDNSTCGNYTGTTEQDLVVNDRYRVTFKSEVVETSADGYEKKIKGTGSVYLPKLSSTAQYVFDIRSEIVRTYAVCKTPDNFAPLVWLDASREETLLQLGSSTNSVNAPTTYGNASDSTRDTLEERADNGSQTTNSWQSDDFEMHTCEGTEFSNAICSNASSRYLNIGMIFSNVDVPRGSTITSASITLACTTPSGTAGSLTHRVYGFYDTSTSPHPSLFTSSGSNQLRPKLSTANLHTVAYRDITANNCPPGNNTVFDVTNVAQEIVNNSNWDPNAGSNGGRMGFVIRRQSGSGSRHLLKTGNQFAISYSTTTVNPSVDTGSVGEWQDISGNANHARISYGNAPTRHDNQINSETIVRFNNGTLLSSLTSALAGKREMTVLAVVKPNFNTSSANSRFVSGMSSTGTNDTTSGSSIIPVLRNSSGNGFSSIYSGSSATYRTDFSCGGSCANTPYIVTSVFKIDSSTNTISSELRGNGVVGASRTGFAPSGSPYTYGINQFYIGGRRTGAMSGGSGTEYFNGDYAEIVIYDKALECRQYEAIEEYLRVKWSISASPYDTTCPEEPIPTI
jgi:hypothetical protein